MATTLAMPGFGFLRVDDGLASVPVSIEARNCPDGVMVAVVHLVVPVGSTLRFGPGVVVKAAGGLIVVVDGRLEVDGPTVFTSFSDDEHGGDTNGDGTLTGPGFDQWMGIALHSGSTGTLERALVRCSGVGSSSMEASDAPIRPSWVAAPV